jgi:hypothetical protein
MKKIYTILSGSFMSLFAFAGSGFGTGKLSVTYQGYDKIKIYVDNFNYSPSSGTVMLDNLQAGYHTVSVYRSNGFSWNIWGRNHSWGKSADQLIYSNSVYVEPFTMVDVMIDRYGHAFIDEKKMGNLGWDGREGDPDRRYDGDDRDHDKRQNDPYGFHGNNGYGYSNLMSDADFQQVKEQLRREWFENNRLRSAQTILQGNNVTSNQVKQLMYLFSFDDNRLEVAKAAYRNTVDKQNFFIVQSALNFENDREELDRFIRTCK